MGINENRYTGYIYCAGKRKDGGNCDRPVKEDGDFCFQHKNQREADNEDRHSVSAERGSADHDDAGKSNGGRGIKEHSGVDD